MTDHRLLAKTPLDDFLGWQDVNLPALLAAATRYARLSINMQTWNNFYQKTAKRGPSPLLTKALSLATEPAKGQWAIDLGCGAGHETKQLLDAGWRVLAIDNEPEAIARTTDICAQVNCARLTTLQTRFEQLSDLPCAGVIHASLSLPFCHPDQFSCLWDQLLHALVPGGVLVGHFFGVRHGWSSTGHMTFHTEQQIRTLCDGMEIALVRETESLIEKDIGQLNWHRFDVIAKKPGIAH